MAGGDSQRPVTEDLGSGELQLHFGCVPPGKYLFKYLILVDHKVYFGQPNSSGHILLLLKDNTPPQI